MSTFGSDTVNTHVFSLFYLKGLRRATYKVIEMKETGTVWPNIRDDKQGLANYV
jgi:hypothetical protein